MVSVSCFNRRFTCDWRMLILASVVVSLLFNLGCWQLRRAEEKQQLIAAEAKQAQRPPLSWQAGMELPKQYQNLVLRGHYLPQLFLLDNQYNEHRTGYHVLSPFALNNNHLVLIDRGWVENNDRTIIPQIETRSNPQQLSGQAYFPSAKAWVLGPDFEQKSKNTTIIERIDSSLLAKLLHKSVYPFIIRLNENEPGGYVRQWTVVNLPPQRHYAYAFQWFAMAIAAVAAFVGLSLKKNDE